MIGRRGGSVHVDVALVDAVAVFTQCGRTSGRRTRSVSTPTTLSGLQAAHPVFRLTFVSPGAWAAAVGRYSDNFDSIEIWLRPARSNNCTGLRYENAPNVYISGRLSLYFTSTENRRAKCQWY